MKHSERIVVITGGSKGIGRAIALKFSEEKARIVILHYDPEDGPANETLDLLKQRGLEAESHRVDVSDHEASAAFFKELLGRLGRVDVLVNNAGITRDNFFIRMSEEAWDAVLNVNLKSVFNCTHAAIRSMIKQRSGRIVNVSSVVGQIGNIGQANYAASKAGIMGFTKTVAREVASKGVTVNAVAPGFINTEMTAVLPEKVKTAFREQIPMGLMGEPEDIAETIFWLCSDGAKYITGQVIHVNGGLYM